MRRGVDRGYSRRVHPGVRVDIDARHGVHRLAGSTHPLQLEHFLQCPHEDEDERVHDDGLSLELRGEEGERFEDAVNLSGVGPIAKREEFESLGLGQLHVKYTYMYTHIKWH